MSYIKSAVRHGIIPQIKEIPCFRTDTTLLNFTGPKGGTKEILKILVRIKLGVIAEFLNYLMHILYGLVYLKLKMGVSNKMKK